MFIPSLEDLGGMTAWVLIVVAISMGYGGVIGFLVAAWVMLGRTDERVAPSASRRSSNPK